MTQSDPETRRLVENRKKSPGLAAVFSIMPGLGQIYVGFYRRGFLHALVTAGIITMLSAGRVHRMEPLFGIFLSFYWFFNIIDAVRMANLYNDAVTGLEDEEMRRALAKAGDKGTIGGGLAILAIGMLFLLHNVFDVSMYWLEDWWPLFPVGFGAYLLYQGVRDRMKRAA
jgi:hypothetical protein